MIYVPDRNGKMVPAKRVRKTAWVHPKHRRWDGYADTGEDDSYLRGLGYEKRIVWVIDAYKT